MAPSASMRLKLTFNFVKFLDAERAWAMAATPSSPYLKSQPLEHKRKKSDQAIPCEIKGGEDTL